MVVDMGENEKILDKKYKKHPEINRGVCCIFNVYQLGRNHDDQRQYKVDEDDQFFDLVR